MNEEGKRRRWKIRNGWGREEEVGGVKSAITVEVEGAGARRGRGGVKCNIPRMSHRLTLRL